MASSPEASCISDPNFAVICAFLERFAKPCGITYPTFADLQEMLENQEEVPQELIDLHIRLLRKARKTVFSEKWEKAVVKFCHSYSSQDGWEIERFGYHKSSLEVKLRVLKMLLEGQFDLNNKFKSEINTLEAGDLRTKPVGKDKFGRSYWVQFDPSSNIRVYREDIDEESWSLVAKDRTSLVELLQELSGDEYPLNLNLINEDSASLDKPSVDTGQNSNSSFKNDVNEEVEEKDPLDISNSEKEDSESVNNLENETNENEEKNETTEEIKEDAQPIKKIKLSEENCENKLDVSVKNEVQDKTESVELNENNEKSEEVKQEMKINKEIETIKKSPKPSHDEIVGEAITEPVMLITGEGKGEDCQTGNPGQVETPNEDFIVGEAIEEPVMYIFGEGDGEDCQTGNPDKEENSQENNEEKNSQTESKDQALESEKLKPPPKLWSIDTICGVNSKDPGAEEKQENVDIKTKQKGFSSFSIDSVLEKKDNASETSFPKFSISSNSSFLEKINNDGAQKVFLESLNSKTENLVTQDSNSDSQKPKNENILLSETKEKSVESEVKVSELNNLNSTQSEIKTDHPTEFSTGNEEKSVKSDVDISSEKVEEVEKDLNYKNFENAQAAASKEVEFSSKKNNVESDYSTTKNNETNLKTDDNEVERNLEISKSSNNDLSSISNINLGKEIFKHNEINTPINEKNSENLFLSTKSTIETVKQVSKDLPQEKFSENLVPIDSIEKTSEIQLNKPKTDFIEVKSQTHFETNEDKILKNVEKDCGTAGNEPDQKEEVSKVTEKNFAAAEKTQESNKTVIESSKEKIESGVNSGKKENCLAQIDERTKTENLKTDSKVDFKEGKQKDENQFSILEVKTDSFKESIKTSEVTKEVLHVDVCSDTQKVENLNLKEKLPIEIHKEEKELVKKKSLEKTSTTLQSSYLLETKKSLEPTGKLDDSKEEIKQGQKLDIKKIESKALSDEVKVNTLESQAQEKKEFKDVSPQKVVEIPENSCKRLENESVEKINPNDKSEPKNEVEKPELCTKESTVSNVDMSCENKKDTMVQKLSTTKSSDTANEKSDEVSIKVDSKVTEPEHNTTVENRPEKNESLEETIQEKSKNLGFQAMKAKETKDKETSEIEEKFESDKQAATTIEKVKEEKNIQNLQEVKKPTDEKTIPSKNVEKVKEAASTELNKKSFEVEKVSENSKETKKINSVPETSKYTVEKGEETQKINLKSAELVNTSPKNLEKSEVDESVKLCKEVKSVKELKTDNKKSDNEEKISQQKDENKSEPRQSERKEQSAKKLLEEPTKIKESKKEENIVLQDKEKEMKSENVKELKREKEFEKIKPMTELVDNLQKEEKKSGQENQGKPEEPKSGESNKKADEIVKSLKGEKAEELISIKSEPEKVEEKSKKEELDKSNDSLSKISEPEEDVLEKLEKEVEKEVSEEKLMKNIEHDKEETETVVEEKEKSDVTEKVEKISKTEENESTLELTENEKRAEESEVRGESPAKEEPGKKKRVRRKKIELLAAQEPPTTRRLRNRNLGSEEKSEFQPEKIKESPKSKANQKTPKKAEANKEEELKSSKKAENKKKENEEQTEYVEGEEKKEEAEENEKDAEEKDEEKEEVPKVEKKVERRGRKRRALFTVTKKKKKLDEENSSSKKEEKKKPEKRKENDEKKSEKRKRRGSLTIFADEVMIKPDVEAVDSSNVRQSRRIAQIRLKEDAERRRLEEEQLESFKSKKEKKSLTPGKKKSKKHEDSESEDEPVKKDLSDNEKSKGKDGKKKKRKKKKDKLKFNELNPWISSTDSSSAVEEEDDIEDEPHEDDELIFKSDHEFSMESDVDDPEFKPIKRARTAKVQESTDQFGKYDDTSCEKCNKNDHPEWILLCDKCDKGWHASCVRPALMVVPEGDWFCPPCEHVSLITKLQESLVQYDKCQKQRENEELRKKRLAFVGISLDNVLPPNRKKVKNEDDDEESSSESESGSESETGSSSSDSSEPVYQLRQRRCNVTSYRYNEYDELIKSALQDEIEAVKGTEKEMFKEKAEERVEGEDDKERGEKEISLEKAETDEGNEKFENVKPKEKIKKDDEDFEKDTEEEEEEEELADEIPPVVPKYDNVKKKNKRKRVTNLEFTSEEEDNNSDSDFKGESEEEESEYSMGSGSESSDNNRRRRRGFDGPLRRSTRARVSRYDRDFINDDSDDDGPRRKKKRRSWDSSEESDTDESWGRKKRKKYNYNKNISRGFGKKSKSKKHKKRVIESGSEDEVKPKKQRNKKIKYGGLDSDEDAVISKRTRGKKINYQEMNGSDSEEEETVSRKTKSSRVVESDDDFVAEKEEEEDQEVESEVESGENEEEEEESDEDIPLRKNKKEKEEMKESSETEKELKEENQSNNLEDESEDLDPEEEEILSNMLESGEVPINELKSAVKKAKEQRRLQKEAEGREDGEPLDKEEDVVNEGSEVLKALEPEVPEAPELAEGHKAFPPIPSHLEFSGLPKTPKVGKIKITPTRAELAQQMAAHGMPGPMKPANILQSALLAKPEGIHGQKPGYPPSGLADITVNAVNIPLKHSNDEPLQQPPFIPRPPDNLPSGPLNMMAMMNPQSAGNSKPNVLPPKAPIFPYPTMGSPPSRLPPYQTTIPATVVGLSKVESSPQGQKPGPIPGTTIKRKAEEMSASPENAGEGSQLSPVQRNDDLQMKGVQDTTTKKKVRGRGKKQLLAEAQALAEAQSKAEKPILTMHAPTRFPPRIAPPEGGSVISRMLNAPQVFPPNRPFRPSHPPPYPNSPIRMRVPVSGTSIFHTSHPHDPSPSGGGAINISPSNKPPPGSNFGPRFPPEPVVRHPFPPQGSPPRPEFPPYPSFYGNFPPPNPSQPPSEEPSFQSPPYPPEQFEDAQAASSSTSKSYEDDTGGEFGGLASYFASQREDDLDT